MKYAVVVGSTVKGLLAAAELRRRGYHVTMITTGTYLLQDITETWRYNAPIYAQDLRNLLLPVAGMLGETLSESDLKTPAAIKRIALLWMQKAGVEVRYMTHIIGLALHNETLAGVLAADRWGTFILPCHHAVDATLYDEATSLAGFGPRTFPAGTKGTARFDLVGVTETTEVFPEGIRVLAGGMAGDHRIVEVQYTLPAAMIMPEIRGYAVQCITAAIKRLVSGYRCMAGAQPGEALPLAVDIEAGDLAPLHIPGWNTGRGSGETPTHMLIGGKRFPWVECEGKPVFPAEKLPVIQGDVCVAGLGTAGIWAAISAQRQGARVVGIEYNPFPGGTRTMGGVSGLYYGNRSLLFRQQWQEVLTYTRSLLPNQSKGIINPVTEALFYHTQAESIQSLPCSVVCGAGVDENKLQYLLVAGEQGLSVVRAKQFIDATGDGDAAVLCGCRYTSGDAETGITQNYSQWNRCAGGVLGRRGIDQDTMDGNERGEWTRSLESNLLTAREYDLFDMLTIRENRRIHGYMSVTMPQVARGMQYHDVLCEAYSTYDPHGRCMDLTGRLGLMPALGKARFVSIPLRAVTVPEVNNLLITGKALDFDQPAFNYIRMSTDIRTLGWIEGILAATCAAGDVQPMEASLHFLQEEMRKLGAITYDVPQTDRETVSVDRLSAGILCGDRVAFHEAMLVNDKRIAAMLSQADIQLDGHIGDLAQRTLLFYGETKYAAVIERRLQSIAQRCEQIIYQDRQNADGVVRCGMVREKPDDYWEMNQMAVLLSMVQYLPARETIAAMMRDTIAGGTWENHSSNYASIRLDCQTLPNYDRMLCMAVCGQLMPWKGYAQPLQQLFHRVNDVAIEGSSFYKEYLLLSIARAAVRCDSSMNGLFSGLKHSRYAVIRRGAQASEPKKEKE